MTKRKKIIVICAFLLISFIIPNKVKAKESASVKYQTHVQDIGWQTQVKDGEIAGTEGQSKRLEAIKIQLIYSLSSSNLLDLYKITQYNYNNFHINKQ